MSGTGGDTHPLQIRRSVFQDLGSRIHSCSDLRGGEPGFGGEFNCLAKRIGFHMAGSAWLPVVQAAGEACEKLNSTE